MKILIPLSFGSQALGHTKQMTLLCGKGGHIQTKWKRMLQEPLRLTGDMPLITNPPLSLHPFLLVAAAYRPPTIRQELHQLAGFVSQLSPKECSNIPD